MPIKDIGTCAPPAGLRRRVLEFPGGHKPAFHLAGGADVPAAFVGMSATKGAHSGKTILCNRAGIQPRRCCPAGIFPLGIPASLLWRRASFAGMTGFRPGPRHEKRHCNCEWQHLVTAVGGSTTAILTAYGDYGWEHRGPPPPGHCPPTRGGESTLASRAGPITALPTDEGRGALQIRCLGRPRPGSSPQSVSGPTEILTDFTTAVKIA